MLRHDGGGTRVVDMRWFLTAILFIAGAGVTPGAAQEAEPVRRDLTVIGRGYLFVPSRIEVNYCDLVKITLTSDDATYTFTLDEYRISKRFAPGRPAIVEFRADRCGRFLFYCNLTTDEGCRNMQGTLIVR
jgi:heme/copper-type cytochrome/quinol oxidase subunit 2